MGIKQPASNIIGNQYGRLLAVSEADSVKCKTGRNLRHFRCICDCGTVVVVYINNLKKGNSQSCGCKRDDTRKLNKTPDEDLRLTTIWHGMKGRCYRKDNPRYSTYGAVGITICKEWFTFSTFLAWYKQTRLTVPDDCTSIERINPFLGYHPDNCTLITRKDQSYNKKMASSNTSGITGVRETCDGRWVAIWSYNNFKGSKSFTIKKYGYEEAKRLAIEARKQAIENLISKGVPYSEYHGL